MVAGLSAPALADWLAAMALSVDLPPPALDPFKHLYRPYRRSGIPSHASRQSAAGL